MSILNRLAFLQIDPGAPPPTAFLAALEEAGFSHQRVAWSAECGAAIEGIAPAAILLDACALPRSNVSEAAALLKERFPYVPVILVLPDALSEAPFLPVEKAADGSQVLPLCDGLVYLSMPPTQISLVLRGAVRAAFTIQELVHSNRKLNEISITDALTGLYNRGYMVNRLNLEFKRAARNQETISCLMIDLDHFKQINDSYGHKFGDVILRSVSERLSGLIRETDIFGRYGGEEFLIVLPNTNLEGAAFLAEKLRHGLEIEKMQHDFFSLLVTASFGVASSENVEVLTPDHLLQFSDRALYRAKEAGRNRVRVAGRNESPSDLMDPAEASTRAPREGTARDALDVYVFADEPRCRRVIRKIEADGEFAFRAFTHEEDLFGALRERNPALIFLAHQPGHVDGFTLCEAVGTHLGAVFVPKILFLPDEAASRWREALQAGADDVIVHELTPRELRVRLHALAHLKELHDRWRGAYQDLTLARARLIRAERLSALGEMAGGVAHDFNNVLSAILGRARLLREGAQDLRLRQELTVIEKAANDGAATIRRIQEFSRTSDAAKHEIIDLAEVVRDCIQMTRTRWKDEAELRGVLYRMETEFQGPLTVRAEATELREVVTNLIMNALDAMPAGGVMRFVGECAEDRVRLAVGDTGEGMSEEVVKRIFDPFFSTKKERGSGLGLSVAYGIVARHDGKIECHSQPGEGTTFRIELPLCLDSPSVRPDRPPARNEPRAQGRLEILVVDDEPAIREIFRDVLEQEGHAVHAVESGALALETLQGRRIDLLFTDLSMPEMSGWELARRVRAEHPDLPIVLTSGWGGEFNRDQLHKHGVNCVLPKPVPFEQLLKITRQTAKGLPLKVS